MGVASLFDGLPLMAVVSQAASAQSAISMARQSRPDVVLMEARLPDGAGADVCRAILSEQPKVRVLMLSADADRSVVVASIQAGAAGDLLKDIDPARLLEAVGRVASGSSVLDPRLTETALDFMRRGSPSEASGPLSALSEQERQITLLVAEGKTNREIGAELSLSVHTIKGYVSGIFQKLHVGRRSQVAALVARGGRDSS